MEDPRVKEALLYEELKDGEVKCNTCERHCKIGLDELGFCKTRKNRDGKLYTLVYGDLTSLSPNPIEKKPLFHFWPGSKALTVGTWSCNFTCPWCQNEDISKHPEKVGQGRYITPEDFIWAVKQYNLQGTSISFNEPTLLFEYSLDVFDLAKKEGFYNTYITNGYMSTEALKLLIKHGLDAMNIDIKGDKEAVRRYCKADVEKVWRNVRLAKEHNIWIELTTLVIPGVNDDEECLRDIASRIRDELGEGTPWHLSRYYPAYRFTVPATPVSSLEKAYEIGKDEGLLYVYAGNVPGHPYENTYCPFCNELLIERYVFDITQYRITSDKRCPNCKADIPIIGEFL
ncbi:MAG: AmmeMemoRadiSam system radical SAM enzyme [Dehalococcoidia bacterium]